MTTRQEVMAQKRRTGLNLSSTEVPEVVDIERNKRWIISESDYKRFIKYTYFISDLIKMPMKYRTNQQRRERKDYVKTIIPGDISGIPYVCVDDHDNNDDDNNNDDDDNNDNDLLDITPY